MKVTADFEVRVSNVSRWMKIKYKIDKRASKLINNENLMKNNSNEKHNEVIYLFYSSCNS